MKKLLSFYHTHKKNGYLIAGLMLSCLFMTPFLLLGTGSIITYHDQLDGELFSYLLTAKYLFTDIRIYPEIMNGLPAAGAIPPAPLFVLLYVLFKPFTAFMISQWIIYVVAFLGMYLLLLKLTGKEFISFGIAVVFMLLPFYPVYGLCIPGQPLLLYAVLSFVSLEDSTAMFLLSPVMKRPINTSGTGFSTTSFPVCNAASTAPCSKTASRSPRWYHISFYCLIIIFYGASSSLVLVGFACLLLLGFFALFQTITALRTRKKISLFLWLSLILLLLTYIVTNWGLIKQVLFPASTYVSHKTEMVLSPQNLADYFKEAFTAGISYAQSYHAVLFVLIILCLLFGVFLFFTSGKILLPISFQSEKKERSDVKVLLSSLIKAAWLLFFILLVSLFYAFYHGSFVTNIRNTSNGILKTFNLDRVCWLLPTAWCILAGYLLSFIADFFSCFPHGSQEETRIKQTGVNLSGTSSLPATSVWKICLTHGIILATLGIWGITVLLHSPLRPNLSKLIKGGDYYALDWENFFAEDIFNQINAAIGKPQEDYHVISVGIYPAAAAYNGFYCLDGYSNNYPLEYKHTFRRIMEGELNKSDYVRDFFDNWGNRCYITTAEQANYYTFEKKWNSVIYDLNLDMDVLKELNCQYIFSAAYLMTAEEKGLTLLQETPFETEDSWYHIYVYVVN